MIEQALVYLQQVAAQFQQSVQVELTLPMVLLMIGLYVYGAFVWMTIAQKLEYGKPWLAWIPIINILLIPILAKRHWAWGFIVLVPIVNIVFLLMWLWNIYVQRNYPGVLSLVPLAGLIPFLSPFATIANFVILGFVAWYDRKPAKPKK